MYNSLFLKTIINIKFMIYYCTYVSCTYVSQIRTYVYYATLSLIATKLFFHSYYSYNQTKW